MFNAIEASVAYLSQALWLHTNIEDEMKFDYQLVLVCLWWGGREATRHQ